MATKSDPETYRRLSVSSENTKKPSLHRQTLAEIMRIALTNVPLSAGHRTSPISTFPLFFKNNSLHDGKHLSDAGHLYSGNIYNVKVTLINFVQL